VPAFPSSFLQSLPVEVGGDVAAGGAVVHPRESAAEIELANGGTN